VKRREKVKEKKEVLEKKFELQTILKFFLFLSPGSGRR